MTYSTGGLIQATDYNGFVSTTASANINATWGTTGIVAGAGYGQTDLTTVSASGVVTATQWATLNNTLTSIATHQGTTITSRTNPVVGNTIAILSNLNSDIGNCYANRNNAATVGSQYTGWTGTTSKTSPTGGTPSPGSPWTITFTHTVTFANTNAFYTFFNAGGYLKFQFGKTSTGTNADAEWNAFVGAAGAGGVVGTIVQTGTGGSKTIASTSYTGTTKINGSGTPTTLTTTTGAFNLTGSPVTIYKQFDTTAPYTGDYVQINASISGTTLTYTTTWVSTGETNPLVGSDISGGSSATAGTFGTAPTVLCTYYPPESTYLTIPAWGTPTIAATVA